MNRIEHDKGGIVYHHFEWLSLNELDKYTILPNILEKIISDNEIGFHYIIKEI